MTVQKILRDDFIEDYETGEFQTVLKRGEDYFQQAVSKKSLFLNYAIGVYVTAYAQRDLFILGECFDTWLYSDTDSCYGMRPDLDKIEQYNSMCREILTERGYAGVEHNNKIYWLGVAELDGTYKEFITQGAKRYALRDMDGNVKITVAGVPKKNGALCLENDLNNFKSGFIFDGTRTGKLTHFYQYSDGIYQNEYGDWYADSINLVPCDYLLATTIEQRINEEWDMEEIMLDNLVYDDEIL
ncbi:MAG: hypothetical protein IKV85_06850 [Ruminococcus sp.]|nr:hypothetical protein [Ruminococcus sp.]